MIVKTIHFLDFDEGRNRELEVRPVLDLLLVYPTVLVEDEALFKLPVVLEEEEALEDGLELEEGGPVLAVEDDGSPQLWRTAIKN